MLVLFLWFDSPQTKANSTPSIDSLTTALSSYGSDVSNVSPNENSTVTVYIHGTASDADGCTDIDTASQYTEVAYRSNIGGAHSCSTDNNSCYTGTVTLAGCSGGADTDINFEYTVDLQYYADPTDAGAPQAATDWTSYIKVDDDAMASASLTDTWEYNSLLAINVTGSIDYGSLIFEQQSSEQSLLFTNTGNRDLDATQTTNGDMQCASGMITTTSTHYSATSGFPYAEGTEFTNGESTIGLNLLQRTNDEAESTKTIYTLLKAPAIGAGGNCGHIFTFTAVADS